MASTPVASFALMLNILLPRISPTICLVRSMIGSAVPVAGARSVDMRCGAVATRISDEVEEDDRLE